MNHDEMKETDTLSVCPSCVEQLENYGDTCAVEAAGNLEVLHGGQMPFVTRLCYNKELDVTKHEVSSSDSATRTLGAQVESATVEE